MGSRGLEMEQPADTDTNRPDLEIALKPQRFEDEDPAGRMVGPSWSKMAKTTTTTMPGWGQGETTKIIKEVATTTTTTTTTTTSTNTTTMPGWGEGEPAEVTTEVITEGPTEHDTMILSKDITIIGRL
jgi:hypothetical protein